MNGHKPFCSGLKGNFSVPFSPLCLPSTIFKESWVDQDIESASKPPIAPGCRHISENTHIRKNLRKKSTLSHNTERRKHGCKKKKQILAQKVTTGDLWEMVVFVGNEEKP